MVEEIEIEEFEQKWKKGSFTAAVLCYTPLCGTCKVALKMFELAAHLHPKLDLYKLNINSSPQLCREWQIKSVPCLLTFQQGELIRQEFAVQSVAHMHEMLQEI